MARQLRSMSVPRSDARGGGARRVRSQARAVLNWRRARMAVTRKITTDMLGVQRRCVPSAYSVHRLLRMSCWACRRMQNRC